MFIRMKMGHTAVSAVYSFKYLYLWFVSLHIESCLVNYLVAYSVIPSNKML